LLYAGLMLTDDGPRVLEFNCRFGDPETQAILPRLDGDLLEALASVAHGALGEQVAAGDRAAVTVVLAGGDYPETNDKGTPIAGIDEAEAAGAIVFHAGTARRGQELLTNGGRILNVTGLGADLPSARAAAYQAVDLISFAGMRFRSDIGLAAAEGHVHS